MADRKNFSRFNMRCGILLRAPYAGARIKSLSLPEPDPRFIILTGKDFQGDNSVDFFGLPFPLLAEDTVLYRGQPVAAVFAPDYESAILKRREVRIEYETDGKAVPDSSYLPPSLTYGWGEYTPEEDDKAKTVTSEFKIDSMAKDLRHDYTVTAWLDGANLHIEAPTQWPHFLRASVEKLTGYPKKNLILHNLPYVAKHDEYLIMPSVLAAIASNAAVRTGLPTELRDITVLARPGIEVKRSTVVDSEGKPLSETVAMTVDEGAYAFVAAEYQRQAMTGLVPSYPLKAFRASVSVKVSNNYPAAFSASLGYGEALASTEYHLTRLAENAGSIPSHYRKAVFKDKRKFTDYLPGFELAAELDAEESAVERSSFNRKWASNNFQRQDFGLFGFIKGIGIASGTGISGFSTTFAKELNSTQLFASHTGFKAMLTYTQRRNVTVSTSALSHKRTIQEWRRMIAGKLDLNRPESIMFLEMNQDTPDAGPDVLSRLVSSFSPQLEAASKKLQTLKDTNQPPVTVMFPAEDSTYPCEFENAGYGTVIIEVVISKYDLRPIANKVWSSFSFSRMLNETRLRSYIKRTILAALEENGVLLSPDFDMDLVVTETGSDGTIASVGELARGLVMAALSNALHQAGGKAAAALPTSAVKLQEVYGKGAKRNED